MILALTLFKLLPILCHGTAEHTEKKHYLPYTWAHRWPWLLWLTGKSVHAIPSTQLSWPLAIDGCAIIWILTQSSSDTIWFPAKESGLTHTMQKTDSILNIIYSGWGSDKLCNLVITVLSNNTKFHHQRSPLSEYWFDTVTHNQSPALVNNNQMFSISNTDFNLWKVFRKSEHL